MYEYLSVDFTKRKQFYYRDSFHNVEVFNVDNEPWYNLNDIVRELDICADPVVMDRCENIREIYGGEYVINEQDVHNIVSMLCVPHAKDFENWILNEVSPAIRNWDAIEKREAEKQKAALKEMRNRRDNEILLHDTLPKFIIHEVGRVLKKLI